MKNMRRASLSAVATCAVAALALVACGDSDADQEPDDGTDEAAVESADNESAEHPEVHEDLEEARQVILDGLDEFGEDQSEFLLADDVSSAEQKYGMWVLPYKHSDATDRVTSQVAIDGGDFTIEAEAADDGTTYVIDQDGNIEQDDS
ncbi:hypothetical protein [Nesterenkonia haasae]|uniref:hypothetical protein n=1 Tax=Nesterenkonia haasae TaxID=2587813 RepID=UPI001391B501|nr:hypothetical protein [Nesterenkonia haasae]NDK32601.1 hypothetical protein [Nesterenkonia haasae]